MKKIFISFFMVLMIAFLVSCQGNSEKEKIKSFVEQSDEKIIIGIKDKYHFSYVKDDSTWIFDGVFVQNGKKSEKVMSGMENNFFRFAKLNHNTDQDTVFDTTITNITVSKDTDEYKEVTIENAKSKLILSVGNDNVYIKRDYLIKNLVDNHLADYQMSFTLRTNEELITREQGAIGTNDPSVVQAELPYALPVIYSKVYSDDAVFNVSNVVDYQNSDSIFTRVRKRLVQGIFEFGVVSSESSFGPKDLRFTDYWSFDTDKTTFYQLIGQTINHYAQVNPMFTESLIYNDNVIANDFETITKGLYENLLDPRTGISNFYGVMTPYGYMEDFNGGWGESFALLDTTKGMLRYALANNDTEAVQKITAMVEVLTTPQANGVSWIMSYDGNNAKSDEYFLRHNVSGGNFSNNSSGEETGSKVGISGWKYYDMLANLSDIAYLTNSQSLKNGFLKLMPFLNTLKMENYAQPVSWFYQTREPATGYEGAGSAGNASTWAYVHLMASILTSDPTLKTYYKEEALKSLDYANNQDYFQMTAMRDAVKPVVIGWNVRANILAYELTEEISYLNSAKAVVTSLFSIYYLNTNPKTFFPTLGFGYADLRERWEAYLEMSQSVWLITQIVEYMPEDRVLLDLLYAVGKTYPYAFPINGNPYGNFQRNPGYDALDGYYIPFEFTTGALVDNAGGEGGTQSAYRQVKEIYGAGEAFLNYLMFEATAKSIDKSILVLSTGQSHNKIVREENKFVVYNASDTKKLVPITFNLYLEGNYKVFLQGVQIGTFSLEQLQKGISFYLDGRESVVLEVKLS